ncbi:MAG: hypothetical protein ACI4WW_00665 [Candidatus Coprovivens sp.]
MRIKEKACNAWLEMCKNCSRHEENFAGVFTAVFENTMTYVDLCDEMCDKFSIATLSKDTDAIQTLYNTANLSDYQKQKIKSMLKTNNELLLTLNPYILDEKYTFLDPYINELVLDTFIQDKLLSLDDYELYIIKKLVDLSMSYGINSHRLIGNIINHVGRSSIPGRNSEAFLERMNSFFNIIKEYEKQYTLDDEIIGNIGFVIKTGIFPNSVEELKDFTKTIKGMLLEDISNNNDIDDLKSDILYALFGMNLSDSKFFVKNFDIEGLSNELLLNEGVIELTTINMILDCEDINKLKEVAKSLIEDEDFKINLFNNSLLEEKLLLIYAREFNKCKPNFDELNMLTTIDGINIYDSGDYFYSIVKTLGAFSDDGNGQSNYYDEWNNDRYRSHINAVSLIRNDNLAFAEQDGKLHVKLGFYGFGETMFLGGGIKDINSTPDSRDMGAKIYSKLCLPSKFIDSTREWHNELDYERKNDDSQNPHFKKNPDFVILDQECEDISQLSIEEQKQFEEYRNNTIRAAKEFGNLPILLINRERIAKNEKNLIRQMLDEYNISHNMELLKKIVIKFNNNRNGCRGPQHKYIREKYFSNQYFQEILDEIEINIPESQKESFYEFVKNEHEKMASCLYDKLTKEIPIQPNELSIRGGLNV